MKYLLINLREFNFCTKQQGLIHRDLCKMCITEQLFSFLVISQVAT